MFYPLGVANFSSFEWNLWSCEICGSVVEWDDLDIHEEFHDPHRHPVSRTTKSLIAMSLALSGIALLL